MATQKPGMPTIIGVSETDPKKVTVRSPGEADIEVPQEVAAGLVKRGSLNDISQERPAAAAALAQGAPASPTAGTVSDVPPAGPIRHDSTPATTGTPPAQGPVETSQNAITEEEMVAIGGAAGSAAAAGATGATTATAPPAAAAATASFGTGGEEIPGEKKKKKQQPFEAPPPLAPNPMSEVLTGAMAAIGDRGSVIGTDRGGNPVFQVGNRVVSIDLKTGDLLDSTTAGKLPVTNPDMQLSLSAAADNIGKSKEQIVQEIGQEAAAAQPEEPTIEPPKETADGTPVPEGEQKAKPASPVSPSEAPLSDFVPGDVQMTDVDRMAPPPLQKKVVTREGAETEIAGEAVKRNIAGQAFHALGRVEQDIADEAAELRAEADARHEDRLERQRQRNIKFDERMQRFDDIITADPKGFWQKRGTWSRIGAALAVAFGAYGAALTGTKNGALEIIQGAIAEEAAHQREQRLAAKESATAAGKAHSKELEMLATEREKDLQVIRDLWKTIDDKRQMILAQFQTGQAAGESIVATGQIKSEFNKAQNAVVGHNNEVHEKLDAYGPRDAKIVESITPFTNPAKMTEKYRKDFVPDFGLGFPGVGGAFRDKWGTVMKTTDAIETLIGFRDELDSAEFGFKSIGYQRQVWGEAKAKADAIHTLLLVGIAKAEQGGGVLSDRDIDRMKKAVGNPLEVLSLFNVQRLNALKAHLMAGMDSDASAKIMFWDRNKKMIPRWKTKPMDTDTAQAVMRSLTPAEMEKLKKDMKRRHDKVMSGNTRQGIAN